MEIVITGSAANGEEIKRKFGGAFNYTILKGHPTDAKVLKAADFLFDFLPEQGVEHYEKYVQDIKGYIFIQSVFSALHDLLKPSLGKTGKFFGFNGLPGFLESDLLEVTSYAGLNSALEVIGQSLATKYREVDDRVGMVTPRVIAMIINEAYFTVQEGTAEKSAIDQAMKLGTNYPNGPFEWADKIGVDNVFRILSAVYKDTRDERYKICPLLKKEFSHEE